MLFPAPAFGDQPDHLYPPSQSTLNLRKYVIFLFLIQILCVAGRLVVGDVMGSVCMLCVCLMAYLTAFGSSNSPPMSLRWVFMWSFFCFINAGFDLAIAAVRSIHVYQHYHHLTHGTYENDTGSGNGGSPKIPVWQIVTVLVTSWIGALSEILGAIIGYKVFSDIQEQEMRSIDQILNAQHNAAPGSLLGPPLHGVGPLGHYHGGRNHGSSSHINNYGTAMPGNNNNGNSTTGSPHDNIGTNNSEYSDPNSLSNPRFSGDVGHINDQIDAFGNRTSAAPPMQPFSGRAHKLED